MSDGGTPPTAEQRAALLRKYRLLCLWRRGKDQSFEAGAVVAADGLASRAAMRALAEEFPGALRELDLLGLSELERRSAVLARTETIDASEEQWIAWILSYHDLMRGVLARKLTAPRGPRRADDPVRPAGGKLSLAVLHQVARRFDMPTEQVAAVLFPSRRGHAASEPP